MLNSRIQQNNKMNGQIAIVFLGGSGLLLIFNYKVLIIGHNVCSSTLIEQINGFIQILHHFPMNLIMKSHQQ